MDAWVREILRCPACGSTLADGDASLTCENPDCGLVYRIEDGIPVLLVDEAVAPDAPVAEEADPS